MAEDLGQHALDLPLPVLGLDWVAKTGDALERLVQVPPFLRDVLDLASEPLQSMIRKYRSCVSILAELSVSPLNVLPIFNKCDLTNMNEIEDKIKALGMIPEDVAITSAKTGFGIDVLMSKLNEMVYARAPTFLPRA